MTQINITTAIVINRSNDTVFNYIQDLKNHAIFSTDFLDRFSFPSKTTSGLGASLKCSIKFLPFSVPTNITVTHLSYPDKLVEEGDQAGKHIKMMWNLLPIDKEHTAVNIVMSCEVNSVLNASAIDIVQNQFNCAYYRALFKLKQILESNSDLSGLKITNSFSAVNAANSKQV